MIVTVGTVILLVVGLLSIALAIYGGLVASEILEQSQGDTESRSRAEEKYYLLSMIAFIVLLARILGVPLFFWMVQSLVPFCPGAMCAYGVLNVGSPYTVFALGFKVLLPFAYGAWIVVELANRKHPGLPILPALARSFAVVLLPLLLADGASDVLTVLVIQPVYAPCCSSLYDVSPPFTPSSLLGAGSGPLIMIMTLLILIMLAAVQWVPWQVRVMRVLTGMLAAAAGLLYLITLHDSYAPLVLGLPNHHCPFCLFQEYPDTALFSALIWLGVAATVWRLLVEFVWSRNHLPNELLADMGSVLRKTASLSITFSLVSMLSHLLLVI
ncbi:MAG: hypothetical protein HXY34_08240 [Candidatus Thorarchaeota archaeon]|nr:hypothetical protein [Candidatus Thorarchaeota archaeon]